MPYPCSHFYFDIKFGDRLYSKEKRPGSPLLFWIWSVAKFDIKVKVTTWIWHETLEMELLHEWIDGKVAAELWLYNEKDPSTGNERLKIPQLSWLSDWTFLLCSAMLSFFSPLQIPSRKLERLLVVSSTF